MNKKIVIWIIVLGIMSIGVGMLQYFVFQKQVEYTIERLKFSDVYFNDEFIVCSANNTPYVVKIELKFQTLYPSTYSHEDIATMLQYGLEVVFSGLDDEKIQKDALTPIKYAIDMTFGKFEFIAISRITVKPL